MNKKKFVVLALLMIAVIALSSCMLVACNNDNDDDSDTTTTITATEGLLISNSDFKVVDTKVTSYPRTVSSWTGAKMYSSGNFKDDVIAGAISLDKALYDANKSEWDDDDDEIYNKLIAGGRYGDNDEIKNALMVYMPEETTDEKGDKIHGATAYGYTSTSFTLAKGAYYKLSVDVLTHKIGGANEEDRGARIYLSSTTYAEFSGIDTHGEWKTYEIYIETSPTSTSSLTVLLGLGKYSSSFTTGLTTGYAFFDNLVLEKIEDDEETEIVEGEAAFEQAKTDELTNNEFIQTTTLKVPNGRFDFGTTTLSSSGTPNNWSLITGNRGKDDPAPTSLGYNAIIDTANFADNYSKYSSTYKTKAGESAPTNEYVPAQSLVNIIDSLQSYTGRVGTNVFMLSQQLMTAQGIRSSRTITIEKNKIYALSVDLYTYGIHGAGASLVLSGSDGKDITIKGISSNKSSNVFIGGTIIDPSDNGYTSGEDVGASSNGWTTYTFYIKGNQFKDYSYNMTIWLGTDGTNDNTSVSYHSFDSNSNRTTYTADGTFSNGWVFIDELNLTELDETPVGANIKPAGNDQTLDCSVDGDSMTGIFVDLTTENLFGEGDSYILNQTTGQASLEGVEVAGIGVPTGWTSNFDASDSKNPVIDGLITEGVVDISSEDVFNGKGTYPQLPYDIVSKNAYMIYASGDSYYEVESAPITIKANSFYRISLWIKTVDISSTSGAYVYVLDKNNDDATLATFSKINTEDYDEYANDWCALTVMVRGAENSDGEISLKFTLGTGTRWDTSTLTSGALYVANMNMTSVTYANYSDTTTGTYVKSVDLSSSNTYTFSNGSFDSYDHDDDNLEEGKPLNEQTVAAMPENWTFSDNTLNANSEDSSLVAGVIALTSNGNLSFAPSVQTNSVLPGVDFNNFYPTIENADDLEVYPGNKAQLLAIGSKDDTAYAAGFSSASISLSANTFYKLSVYVKTASLQKASIFLTGDSSSSVGENSFTITEANQDWTKYTFVIRVGNTSVSLNLNLWLGQDVKYAEVEGDTDEQKAENAKSTGAVFFDNIIYNTITEDDFNDAQADDTTRVISFLTDSFDAISTTIESRTSLTTPKGWTGAVDTNQSSSNTKSGVIFADSNFLETQLVDGVEYVKILGKEYTVDDIDITDEELASAKEESRFEGMSDDEIIDTLKEERVLQLKKDNWMPIDQLKAHSGSRMLIINNVEKSAYTYSGTAITLKENSFYEVTVWMRTYQLSDDELEGAYIELYLGSADETDKPFIFKAVRSDEWTKYTFLVQTLEEEVTSVSVKLSLGKYHSEDVDGEKVVTGTTSGFAMFDDVTVKTIDEETFENTVEAETLLKRTVAVENEGTGDEEEENNTTPANSFNTEYLWWMIPTIILGLLIIIVVVVFVIRKIKKQPASKKKAKATTPDASKTLDTKRGKYDENKE